MCSVQVTAPRRAMAREQRTNSGVFGSCSATTSPAAIPRRRRPAATRRTRSSTSFHEKTRSWNTSAEALGRSRTWRASQRVSVSSAHQPRALYSASLSSWCISKYINWMDEALMLSRVQFGLNIGFHILFPTITIGLGWLLLYFRVRYERTRDPAWLRTYKLWVKVFALSFAMGVVTGITMSFQFGTNWPGYMNTVGNIAGPLLAYEVLTAFFLEATFLGVMIFGMQRVSGRMHVASALIVAFGTTLSAFWILALNSWMQTPTGHTTVDHVLIAQSWWRVIFNPSFPFRLAHMLLASGITASFLVAGLSACRLLAAPPDAAALKTLRFGARLAALLVPLQIFVGDQHGLNTLKHQPAKIAALEAIWHTERGAALTLFGIPNEAEQRTDFAIVLPKGAALILAHDADAELKGLDAFP